MSAVPFSKITFACLLVRLFSFNLIACAICIHGIYLRSSSGELYSLPCTFTLAPLRYGGITLVGEVFVTRTLNWNREIGCTSNSVIWRDGNIFISRIFHFVGLHFLRSFFLDILGNDFWVVWLWCRYSCVALIYL